MNFKLFARFSLKSIVLILGLYFLTGCTAQPLDLSLAPTESMPIGKSGHQSQYSIGVTPFIDERPVRHGSDNAKWKGLIPGVLWIEISSDIPETYTAYSHYEAKPLDRASTKASVGILQRSGLFADVVDLHKYPKAETKYQLNGIVYQTMVIETGYYYGSCIYAWLVRVLGLPYVSFEIQYHVGLNITDQDTGKIIWQADLKGTREDKFYTVYSVSRGRDGKHVIAWNVSDILAEEFNKHIDDIQQAIAVSQ